jgi:uncharacterized Zn finger protein (UPF0148 family)
MSPGGNSVPRMGGMLHCPGCHNVVWRPLIKPATAFVVCAACGARMQVERRRPGRAVIALERERRDNAASSPASPLEMSVH